MTITELDGLTVFSATGERLGRVREVVASNGRITELVYGRGGLIQRLTGRPEPTSVPWSAVRVAAERITLK